MAETIAMPKLGFDMQEGTLVHWLKKEGETIDKGEVLAEIETDKATVEVEASAGGTLRRLLVDEGVVVPVGSPIAIVGSPDEQIEVPTPIPSESKPEKLAEPAPSAPLSTQIAPQPTPVAPSAAGPSNGRLKASPLARRMAQEKRLDLADLHGSGPGGRIVRRDVEAALSGGSVPSISPLGQMTTPASMADETVPLTKLRQAVGRRMVESKTGLPHFYVTHEYSLDLLLGLREQYNRILPEGEKLSVNDFIVKAAALTLCQFPNLNASLDGGGVVRHGAINIGVAVAVEGGLLTVVCRRADQKPLRQISSEVKAMAQRARQGKVRPADIEGSTFSVSNLGMYEVENFIAIINPPEAAILALGAARQVPVVEEGQVKPGWRMKATISVDHRISDGAEAAQFMQALAAYLEEPLRLVV
jgi:pyruvate dehydrogenase E2 component (dihydrolipoamide acetyltransferase)